MNLLPPTVLAGMGAELAALPEVRLAFLFGSRARGEGRSDSDFDVAVLFDEAPVPDAAARGNQIRGVAARLGRHVSAAHLDLVVLNGAPALRRHRVLRDGVLLHERFAGERARFAMRTIRDYQDGQIRRQAFTELRIQRLREGSPQMVDREIFSRRLEALRGYLGRLEKFREVGESEFVREPAIHDLAERYLHLAVEAALDLANHWIADRALPTPDANRDTFTVLERAGELDPALAERLRGWAGLRNILVHEYLTIDHAIAYHAIQNELTDLAALDDWAVQKLTGSGAGSRPG